MKINKDSWHYRFWAWTYRFISSSTPPYSTDLCGYCQRIFWSGFFLTLSGSLIMTLFGAFLFLIFYQGLWLNTANTLAIFGVLFVIGATGYLFYRYKQRDHYREPGLVSLWMKARKKRFCPFLEFVESSDKVEVQEDQAEEE